MSAVERADLDIIREIVMAEMERVPELAKEARKVHGILFPRPFVDELLYMKQDEEDNLACEHCGFYMNRITWKNYFSEQWFKCPHCNHRHLDGELVEWRYHPLVLFGYLLHVCKLNKWELGITAIRQAIETFESADKRLHKITEELGKHILEGGELN